MSYGVKRKIQIRLTERGIIVFEVLEIRKVSHPGKGLKALASVRLHTNLGNIDLLNFRIIKQDNGRWYVQIPSVNWLSQADSKIHFQPLIQMPSDLQQKIELEIIRLWLKENSHVNEQS